MYDMFETDLTPFRIVVSVPQARSVSMDLAESPTRVDMVFAFLLFSLSILYLL